MAFSNSETSLFQYIRQSFGLDLRSLALFRISLAIIIIVDLIFRFRDIKAHYTDFGILPRAALIENFLNPSFWSFHLFSGSIVYQIILFIVAIVLAFFLLIGYRTRLINILSWILLVSLHNRNFTILNGGDTELRLLLFWSMFLPLGAYYSVDSCFNQKRRLASSMTMVSFGSFALTMQVCFIYWFAWLHKLNPIWHKEGSAVYYALNIDQFATHFGNFLLNFPSLLSLANHTTLWIELIVPFLLFIPFKNGFFRCLTVATFILLHLGFAAGLELGLFPFIAIVAWLAFIPSLVWSYLHQKIHKRQKNNFKIYYQEDRQQVYFLLSILCTFLFLPKSDLFVCDREQDRKGYILSKSSWYIIDEQDRRYRKYAAIVYLINCSPVLGFLGFILKIKLFELLGQKIYSYLARLSIQSNFSQGLSKAHNNQTYPSKFTDCIALLLIFLVTLWNLHSLAPDKYTFPHAFREISLALRLDQHWNVFAPPLTNDGWYVIPGELQDGTKVNLFQENRPLTWEKSSLVSATYPNQRWRKYMMDLHMKKNTKRRLYYGKYLCRKWNNNNKGISKLQKFSIYFMLEKTLPNYQKPKVEKINLWDHECFKKPES